MDNGLFSLSQSWDEAFSSFASLRWVVVVLVAVAITIVVNRLLRWIIPPIVKVVAQRADNTNNTQKIMGWRRIETFLGIILAATKVVVFLIAVYVVWRTLNPHSAPVAVVGASALFAVLAGATIAPLLRDLTNGMIMIAERWYNVGDHISLEPFVDVSGVVESVTLRSTQLRSLKGEIIMVHNQHIQGVRIAPRGVRTLALDVFVTDPDKGKAMVETAISALPAGATMVAKKVKITDTEKLGDGLWRISASGQTPPGREWLIEDFAVHAIKQNDVDKVIMYGPIVHYADESAERRFKRSVRAD